MTKLKNSRTIRIITCLTVLCAVLVAGRLVMTKNASADDAQAPEAAMGEALMAMGDRAEGGPDASGGAGWYVMTVHRTGAGWDNVYLHMGNASVSARWFKAREDQESKMLATALTAISTNKQVYVYVDGTGFSPYGEIKACYVMK